MSRSQNRECVTGAELLATVIIWYRSKDRFFTYVYQKVSKLVFVHVALTRCAMGLSAF